MADQRRFLVGCRLALCQRIKIIVSAQSFCLAALLEWTPSAAGMFTTSLHILHLNSKELTWV